MSQDNILLDAASNELEIIEFYIEEELENGSTPLIVASVRRSNSSCKPISLAIKGSISCCVIVPSKSKQNAVFIVVIGLMA